MRTVVASALCAGLLLVSASARAEGMNNFYAFVNGIAVAPTDPFYYVIAPPEDLIEGMPAGEVTARIVGVPAGLLMGGFRVFMATGDLVFFPFWVFPVFSPEPDLFLLIEDVEYE